MADITQEIADIQAASHGSEIRQPMVDALNKLNTASLPAVSSSDSGKLLKVNSDGEWVAGTKSGFVPLPVDWTNVANTPTTATGYGIESVDVDLLDGVIDPSHIPQDAFERLYIVETEAAMFALTKSQVQNGDVVKVMADSKMYFVRDDDNLDSWLGYAVFTAGMASSVEWSGVQNKPALWYQTEIPERNSDEGNPVIFQTSSAQLAKNTKVTFEPIQDLHGYDHPWPAGGGKNLLDIADTTISSNNYVFNKNNLNIPAGTYTFSFDCSTNGTVSFAAGSANGDYVNDSISVSNGKGYVTFTASSTITNARLYGFAATYSNIQLESGSTVTSWEPYSNICPISGLDEVEVKRTGFNLWDEEWELGGLTPDTGEKASASDRIRSKNYIRVFPNTNYYFTYLNSNNYTSIFFYVCEYDSNKNFIRRYSFSPNTVVAMPTECHYIRFFVYASPSVTTYNHDICINLSDPAKNGTYEPYQGYTASLDLPDTIYSGELDLETGVLVADMGMVDLGTLTWQSTNHNRWESSAIQNMKVPANNQTKSNAISDAFECFANDSLIGTDSTGFAVHSNVHFMLRNNLSSTPTGHIVYPLATPITYHLTPQQLALFKGTNVVSTNASKVRVTYRDGQLALMGDTPQQLQIEEAKTDAKLKAVLGNFAEIEGDTVSKNYSVGSYLVHNGLLRKVTSAIASGESVTNLNSTVTTIADELTLLWTAVNA